MSWISAISQLTLIKQINNKISTRKVIKIKMIIKMVLRNQSQSMFMNFSG